MSTEDLEKYETEMELQLYREYRDIVRQFTYVVETERRFYLANSVDLQVREAGGEVYFELKLSDAWVWDMYRPARFVRNVRVLTFKDVNVEELDKPDLELPDTPRSSPSKAWTRTRYETSKTSAAETTCTRPPVSGFMVSQPAGEKRTSASSGGRLATTAERSRTLAW